MDRIFLNHPKVGTLLVRKTRPGQRSKRFRLAKQFLSGVQSAEYPNMTGFHVCKVCGTHLINPQSILMHIGNGCEKNIKNA